MKFTTEYVWLIDYLLIDFNDMSSRLGLFYA